LSILQAMISYIGYLISDILYRRYVTIENKIDW